MEKKRNYFTIVLDGKVTASKYDTIEDAMNEASLIFDFDKSIKTANFYHVTEVLEPVVMFNQKNTEQ